MCSLDTFIKTYLQYTDLLKKEGFYPINYDPTVTTTKPITTTKPSTTTKPVSMTIKGTVVEKNLNSLIIKTSIFQNAFVKVGSWFRSQILGQPIKTEVLYEVSVDSQTKIFKTKGGAFNRFSYTSLFDNIEVNDVVSVNG